MIENSVCNVEQRMHITVARQSSGGMSLSSGPQVIIQSLASC